jgi:phenylalanyl-tRNA synthetase beta chain
MEVPLTWLKEFVDIDLSVEELAKLLTMLGLEVEGIRLVGLEAKAPALAEEKHEFPISGLAWPAEKFVVAQVDEVLPHPNADRLVLCRLNDGTQEYTVLTGAPNLYEYKGKGTLTDPLKVAYAREGAQLYDGHQPGLVLTTLKRMKIRGVESYSMICSEKELGISEEHEGVMLLDKDAPTGMPLSDYMGDIVLSIKILPNMIRNACVLGIAREISAVTRKPLRKPQAILPATGPSIKGKVGIKITDPKLNPRFVLGLVRDTKPLPSPYHVQRRLKLAGVRPINGIVDATNYVMLEVGEPLHAFDYDVLVKRAGGKTPTIITRSAKPGEKLTTLDNVIRNLDDFTILVTDTAGALSLAGVMGGQESEVTENTRNVLLEGASWNFTNIRRTITAQRLLSEASYRFSRGIHPALAETGVRLGMDRIAQWGGGQIAADLVDAYPDQQHDPQVMLSTKHVKDLLGISLTTKQIVDLLQGLEFTCKVEGETITAQTPPHRLDIGEGVVGRADLMEEIVRLYGYDKIPSTRLADELPPQRGNPLLEREQRAQDILASLGLQEVITYRLTTPESANRLYPTDADIKTPEYVELQNPITPERRVMRHSILESVLEILEKNWRQSERLAMFEIGPVYIPRENQLLPDELIWLAIAMTGKRYPSDWDQKEYPWLYFYDLKGIVETFLKRLQVKEFQIRPAEHISFNPGKCAKLFIKDQLIGTLGELHPLVKEHYDMPEGPLLAAKFDLTLLLSLVPDRYEVTAIPTFPPVLEDLAVIVAEATSSEKVMEVIYKAGGKILSGVRLFDIYRGDQIGKGCKSLAYSLTYQADDRTLNAAEVGKIREQIFKSLEKELNAQIRS